MSLYSNNLQCSFFKSEKHDRKSLKFLKMQILKGNIYVTSYHDKIYNLLLKMANFCHPWNDFIFISSTLMIACKPCSTFSSFLSLECKLFFFVLMHVYYMINSMNKQISDPDQATSFELLISEKIENTYTTLSGISVYLLLPKRKQTNKIEFNLVHVIKGIYQLK